MTRSKVRRKRSRHESVTSLFEVLVQHTTYKPAFGFIQKAHLESTSSPFKALEKVLVALEDLKESFTLE